MGNCISCAFVIPVPNALAPKQVSFKKDDLPTVKVSLDEPQEVEDEPELEIDEPIQVPWYERDDMFSLISILIMFLFYVFIIIVLGNIVARFYNLD